MASTTSTLLRSLSRPLLAKRFSTSPVQISLASPAKSIPTVCARVASSSFVLTKRNTYSHPLAMGNPYYEEEELAETNPDTMFHLEAMQRWRDEAQKLFEIMNTDDIVDNSKLPSAVQEKSSENIQSLMEELYENDLLDPRLRWTAKVDY